MTNGRRRYRKLWRARASDPRLTAMCLQTPGLQSLNCAQSTMSAQKRAARFHWSYVVHNIRA
jgi:hypothetical protein